MCLKGTTAIYLSNACSLHLKKAGIAAIHLHLNFSSSNLTRIQLNESAQFAKKAAEVNKTSRDADKKRHQIQDLFFHSERNPAPGAGSHFTEILHQHLQALHGLMPAWAELKRRTKTCCDSSLPWGGQEGSTRSCPMVWGKWFKEQEKLREPHNQHQCSQTCTEPQGFISRCSLSKFHMRVRKMPSFAIHASKKYCPSAIFMGKL